MQKREKDCLDKLLGKDEVLFSEKVRYEVGIGTGMKAARMVSTRTRLYFCSATPMGF